jgi:hypothetical protein
MKKIHYLLAFLVCLSANFYAQEKKEQIKAAKVAFITNELNLTPTEAEKFWPIFNAFDDKQHDIRKNKIKGFRDRKENDLDKLSEKEAATIIADMEKNEEELYGLRKKFITSLKGIIPSVKILKLKKAEENFSRKLLRQYKEKRD